MNRLVIIGNGFDLAHGLPTSYRDFIDDFWKNVKDNYAKKIDNELIYINKDHDRLLNHGHINIQNFKDFLENLINYSQLYEYKINENDYSIYNKKEGVGESINIFKFKNNFFRIINSKNAENWVDIENEYYVQMKKIVKSNSPKNYITEESWEIRKKHQIEKLNKEFEQIKNLLEKYLKEKVVKEYNFNIPDINELNKFHNIFYPDILENSKIHNWRENFSKDDKDYIDDLIEEKKLDQVKLRFLNFNYTPTLSIYYHMNRNLYNNSENFIHGKLNDQSNKINFGFGDEMDDDYKMIENLDDNEYLKNFKSFQYLQNDNYKNLLDFIESERFEVFIMGSSCGLSDRTLLNTIFEHKNCRLIKVFYYQYNDKNTDEIKDNFTELTQNISRHFNDKKLMRSKIVHKKPEQIMPKIQLPKKG